MSNKKLYQETFSQVRSTTVIDWDSMEKKQKKKRFFLRRAMMLAAAVALIAVFSTMAVADRWFGLRSLELQEEVTVTEPDGKEVTVSVPTGTISLAGFDDTPESKALEEWKNFLSHYNDGGALERIGNAPSGFEEEYGMYLIYTQEMADKFEEILAKYELKKHTAMIDNLYPAEELCAQLGGDFLRVNHAGAAYMYEDGTFAFDGDIDLPGYGLLDYQFMRCVRGSFTDVMLNIGSMENYTEWVYTTSCGIPVTLALSPSKGLVLVDLPDSFVTINVLAGAEYADEPFSSGRITAEQLQQFADSFDFSVLTPALPADPALTETAPEEAARQEEAAAFYLRTGLEEAEAQRFYAEFLSYAESGDRQAVARMIFYPAELQIVGEEPVPIENAEAFLPYYDIIFTEDLWERIHSNQYTKERADLVTHDGMVGAANGFIWFALTADGEIGIMTIQNEAAGIRRGGPAGITPN